MFFKPHPRKTSAHPAAKLPYWSLEAGELLRLLGSSSQGLSDPEAARRLAAGPARTRSSRRLWLQPLKRQFSSPLILILFLAAGISMLAGEWSDASVIAVILLLGAAMGFSQEYRASREEERLMARVAVRCQVLRQGRRLEIPSLQVVPGDLVLLSAGSLVPADGVLLESKDLFVNQAALTGESLPAEKHVGLSPQAARPVERGNCAFAGTSVRSGTATMLAVAVGGDSEYGKISQSLEERLPDTEFERGLRRYGYLLMKFMLGFFVLIFAFNVLLSRPVLESVLFTLALAVGISPELLPAVLGVALSKGARRMAARGVLVKRLNAMENLAGMDVLCADKTGTLTLGVLDLDSSRDTRGREQPRLLRLACLNASMQTGLANPLDQALLKKGGELGLIEAGWEKVDEIPYDFQRRRLTIVARAADQATDLMVTKGALENVLDVCDRLELDGQKPMDEEARRGLLALAEAWEKEGLRVLGLASRDGGARARYGLDDERGLCFAGFLLFSDPPHPDAKQALAELEGLGVALKILSGDSRHVVRAVAERVGLEGGLLSGGELAAMTEEALWQKAPDTAIFAELDPQQKERVVRALQHRGEVVGFLGDGINDAPALHAADVGFSVESAVDVAREASDLLLLRHDLRLLCRGVEEGRATFANTMKYIFVTSSANFGNMLSMALASLFLPFLPLLAGQVLLNNLLSDIPALALASDSVDADWEKTPHRWDLGLIRRFTLRFGFASSLFDGLTFFVLLGLFHAGQDVFRTGWFLESLLSELAILFVMRSLLPLGRSRPSRSLLWLSLGVAVFSLALPYLPMGAWLGLVPLSPGLLASLLGVTLAYTLASEWMKRWAFRQGPQASSMPPSTTTEAPVI